MSDCVESYLGDCCQSCDQPDPPIITAFDIQLIASADADTHQVWSDPIGGSFVTVGVAGRHPDRASVGALKPGRWAWTLTISGATALRNADDVWFDIVGGFASYSGQGGLFNSGHNFDVTLGHPTVDGSHEGQFTLPCSTAPLPALLYFQELRTPFTTGIVIVATGTWLSDPP